MKTIITAALTGALSPKHKNPHIPVTPKEIAEDGIRCWKAGAAILHLHMRDENFRGSMDKERFAETARILRGECDAVLNFTSNGELGLTFERRVAAISEVKPEIATFNSGSLNVRPDGIMDNTVGFLTELGKLLNELQVKPEIECMDCGMVASSLQFLADGVLKAPLHYQFVLGFYNGLPASPENLMFIKNMIPKDATWSTFGIGTAHLPIMYTALALGGNIRVGLEDNIYYSRGKLATNLDYVERAVRVVKEYGNEVATSADARQMLGLRGQ